MDDDELRHAVRLLGLTKSADNAELRIDAKPGKARLGAFEVEALIAWLAEQRAGMWPPVAIDHARPTFETYLRLSHWQVGTRKGLAELLVRLPGHGWAALQMEPEEARCLGRTLLDRFDAD